MLEHAQETASNKKSPKTTLEVRIGSDVIRDSKAADVFCDALNAMGLDRVASVSVEVCRMPLVSKSRPAQIGGSKRGYKERGGWFIVTHSSTREKKAVLEQVAQTLKVPIQVDILTHGQLLDRLLNE